MGSALAIRVLGTEKSFIENKYAEIYDPIREQFKEKSQIQTLTCFYPNQRVSDKYKERFCDSFAVKMWKCAYEKSDSHSEGATQQELEEYVKGIYGLTGSIQERSTQCLIWTGSTRRGGK